MPIYFRKRPGSKNIKANVTQRGLRSFTFTSGGKRGEPRFNLNTSRGFSASIPGTGFMFRQKGYGNANYKNVVEERGYDLRTKEGKEQHAKEKFKYQSSVACVVVGAGAAWFFDSLHGLWVGYLLFWVLFAIGEKSTLTFIWAIFAHLGVAIGYALSFVFNSEPLELSLWGIWLASFLFSVAYKKLVPFLFSLAVYTGIWAFLAEPSLYFQQLPSRIFAIDLAVSVPSFNILYSGLNLYGVGILLFGVPYYLFLISKLINAWNTNQFVKLLTKIFYWFVFMLFLLPMSLSPLPIVCLLLGLRPEKIDAMTTPIIFLGAIGYSVSFGYYINRIILREKAQKQSMMASIIQCLLGLYWLPVLRKTPVLSTYSNIDTGSAVLDKSGTLSSDIEDVSYISKEDYENILGNIRGLGEVKKTTLLEAYPDVQLFLKATDDEISSNTRSVVGKKMARKIRNAILAVDIV